MSVRLDPDDYTVAWIAVLPIEAEAALGVLDLRHEGHFEYGPEDDYIYIGGEINDHNIVIATLPAGQNYGVVAAAALVNQLKQRFKKLWFTLVVGVAAGLPNLNPESSIEQRDIRLGDVLVCVPQKSDSGIVQYDFGTHTEGVLYLGGRQAETSTIIRSAFSNIRLTHPRPFKRGHIFATYLEDFHRKVSDEKFLCRSQDEDQLYPTSLHMINEEPVLREPRDEDERTQVWYGKIGSGNQLMRDAVQRDKLRDNRDLIGLEMESAGIMNSLAAGVIRGVCDYGDEQKNKNWQPYAAAVAAVYAKGVLYTIVPRITKRSFKETELVDGEGNQKRQKTNDHSIREFQISSRDKKDFSEEWRNRCIESLKFDQMGSRHFTIRPAYAQTCQWLFTKPEYKEWWDNEKLAEHCGLLWIKGKPGTGKSTITKFVFECTKKATSGALVVSFFFNARGSLLERSTTGMYRSLIIQLLEQVTDLRDFDELFRTVYDDIDTGDWNLDKLKQLFQEVVCHIQSKAVVLFIDALDECDEEEIRDMIGVLEALGELAMSSNRRFRACFSSRHYPHISISKALTITLEDQDGHKEDLALYIKKELKIGYSNMAQKMKQEVLERSQKIFLWVVLVIPVLKKEYDSGRMHAIQKRLKIIPSSLEKLFDDIMTRDGPPSQELISCLQWVLYSRQPLHPNELYFAILAGSDDNFPCSINETSEEQVYKYILDCSKGLTEITKVKKKTVQFIHESVRDFFLKGTGLTRPYFQPADTFAARSHDHLKLCCQIYYENPRVLASIDPPSPLPKANTKDAANIRSRAHENHPFLEYAINNVLYHSDAAELLGYLQDDYLREFDKLHWKRLNNILERFEIRRYCPEDDLLRILIDRNLPHLTMAFLKQQNEKNLNYRDGLGRTLLSRVASKGEKAIVEFLLKQDGVDVNYSDKNGTTPLMSAAEGGHEAVVKLLLDREDISINSRDRSGTTALARAASNGWLAVVKLLLDRDEIDVNCEDAWNNSAFIGAIFNGRVEVLKLLLDRDDLILTWEGVCRLFFSFTHDDHGSHWKGLTQQLISRADFDVNMGNNPDEEPLLICAIVRNNLDVTQLLLSRPDLEVNVRDREGSTALSIAIESGRAEIIQLLLSRQDLNVNLKYDGLTALSIAIKLGRAETSRQLLYRQDIDVNIQDHDGKTALLLAIQFGQASIVRQLLRRRDTKVNLPNSGGTTALSLVIHLNERKMAQKLLSRQDIDVNLKNRAGCTALSLAAELDQLWAIELLLSRDEIRTDIPDRLGDTPIFHAVGHGRYNAVDFLLQRAETNSNLLARDGCTPLILAVTDGNLPMVTHLLKKANNLAVDCRDKHGYTALFWAVLLEFSKLTEVLSQHGADLSAVDHAQSLDLEQRRKLLQRAFERKSARGLGTNTFRDWLLKDPELGQDREMQLFLLEQQSKSCLLQAGQWNFDPK